MYYDTIQHNMMYNTIYNSDGRIVAARRGQGEDPPPGSAKRLSLEPASATRWII